ncbi:triacylglycerol lipase [Gemella sp. GH3]|uniref:lipase family protein n=1 Tax=unclassified Gemella TaxID=2624949 RepID=UPI0015D04F61|nr:MULTISPECIES: triacylglycerol lipase [unclassified Gemella]MBF0713119.1 triacylglycerol lipase [Gemella sp. GH3.1]NYS50071.1 triacylglycerol lipase [Gemella sp. GH3]
MKNKKFITSILLAMLITPITSLDTFANETKNISQLENTKNDIQLNTKVDNKDNVKVETTKIKENTTVTKISGDKVDNNTENIEEKASIKSNSINENNIDSDGDGIVDSKEKPNEIHSWNFSDRDALMFSWLSYLNDDYIKNILDENSKLVDNSKDKNKITMIKQELSSFWKVKKTYHYDNGFDAVIFETKSKNPNIKSNINVLAIAGTNGLSDIDDDLALFAGSNPKQATSVENLIDSLSLDPNKKNLYITGHSLGGYLSLRAHSYAFQKGYDFVKKSVTFNAPKVKGNIFNRKLKETEKIVDKLTRDGKSVHYKVNNDNVIPLVGFVKEAISVGNTAGKHSLSSFYEEQINNLGYFSIGTRQDITGKQYEYIANTTNKNSSNRFVKSVENIFKKLHLINEVSYI